VLLSQRGQMAPYECAHLQGTLLGIATVNEAGGVLGRELRPIVCDPASDLARSKRLAEALITTERVSHLFGCSDSTIRKALMPIVERHDALLWYPTQFEGFEYSPNIIYGGACPNQHIIPLFDYLLAQGMGRFLFIGSDYVFPRESNRVARQVLEAAGGRVVRECYVPTDAGKEQIKAALGDLTQTPDAIFSTVIGPAAQHLYAALADLGINPARTPIASIGTCEIDISAAPDLLAGHICAVPYFESIGESANSSFLRAFHRRFGNEARSNWFSVNSFMQVQLFAHAAEIAGSVEATDVAAAVGLSVVDGPMGLCRIDPETNYTYCRPRVGVANGRGNFDLVYDAAEPVRPDPFLVTYA
jgi:ABC-type branched-subunit amino acid transport system substrate-binding protein